VGGHHVEDRIGNGAEGKKAGADFIAVTAAADLQYFCQVQETAKL
jgi:hypothetical protein